MLFSVNINGFAAAVFPVFPAVARSVQRQTAGETGGTFAELNIIQKNSVAVDRHLRALISDFGGNAGILGDAQNAVLFHRSLRLQWQMHASGR